MVDQATKHAILHEEIKNLGVQNQYVVIQIPANYQGVSFYLLINFGNTHSILSPKCLEKLKLNQYLTRPMTNKLDNGKEVLSQSIVGNLGFEIGVKITRVKKF